MLHASTVPACLKHEATVFLMYACALKAASVQFAERNMSVAYRPMHACMHVLLQPKFRYHDMHGAVLIVGDEMSISFQFYSTSVGVAPTRRDCEACIYGMGPCPPCAMNALCMCAHQPH